MYVSYMSYICICNIYIYMCVYIYINILNDWIKQLDNSGKLLSVSCFLQSSGVHILHISFP